MGTRTAPLRFQLTAWLDADIHVDDLSSQEQDLLLPEVPDHELFPASGQKRKSPDESYQGKHYVATVFGRCADGTSVAVRLLGFAPVLYVRVGDGKRALKKRDAESVLSVARECAFKRHVKSCEIVSRTEYHGFTNNEKRDFVAVQFLTKSAMRASCSQTDFNDRAKRSLWDQTVFLGAQRQPLHPYEAHIEPLLRLMHIRDLEASGWVEVDVSGRKCGSWANTGVCYSVSYEQIKPSHGKTELAPITTCSFDLECTSKNKTDFPKPRQNYGQTANNIHDVHDRATSKRWPPEDTRLLIQACLFKAMRVPLHGSLQGTFDRAVEDLVASDRDMNQIFPKTPVSTEDLLGISSGIAEDIDDFVRNTYAYTKDFGRSNKTDKVAKLMDKHLPELMGDEIIQIGATFNVIGSEECTLQWIGTLGECSPIQGVAVESFDTEADLLMAFSRLVLEQDPDIYNGYNVWGFDQNYLYTRACELGIETRFLRMSKLRNRDAYYEEKQLSSSAMGHNHNMLVTIPGRVNVDLMHVIRKEYKFTSYSLNSVSRNVLQDEKDDVSAQDIFRLQDGSADDRATIARYCVQDCALVTRLTERLTVVINAIAMSNVCSVPLQYIFSRGQGIKCTSQVARVCRDRGFIMKTLPRDADEKIFYDGARVLEPKTGLYDRPVFCLDYASLYPSCMMSHNICATSKVTDPKYLGLPGMKYNEVSFNVYKNKRKVGVRTVHYAQPESGERAVLPFIEETLKMKRSETRAKMKWKKLILQDGSAVGGAVKRCPKGYLINGQEYPEESVQSVENYFTDFQKSVLNGEQLAYKVTGNSLYGAQGASTSDIRDVDCAASITAVGRSLIDLAKEFLEGEGCDVVYGDTDSCFATVPVYGSDGKEVTGEAAVSLVIQKAKELEEKFVGLLPRPHVCEYEKIYYPWILLSKKRYLGYKYEEATDTPKFSYNGIVLVRRDNCDALKDVVSDLCKRLLVLDIEGAIEGLRGAIDNLVEGRTPLEKLTITKTLGDSYKNPEQIAHWVLAQRIGRRDPARKPRSNDRMAFAFVTVKNPKALQGERIETPDYIAEKRLKLDYSYYLEHQIMTPVCQILAAAVDRIPGYNLPLDHWKNMWDTHFANNLKKHEGDVEEAQSDTRKRVDEEKSKHVKRMIFDPIITKLRNKNSKQREITTFFRPSPASVHVCE
eukprot:jgi/Tetstr1/447244/TSEL_034681.t1